jgi:hypothetical protein
MIRKHVDYKIKRQSDGSYVILQKDLTNKKVDIHSTHDTFEEAEDELAAIHTKPSQAETMKFFHDLKNSMT